MKPFALSWSVSSLSLEEACNAFFTGAGVLLPSFGNLFLNGLKDAIFMASDRPDSFSQYRLIQACFHLHVVDSTAFPFRFSASPDCWELKLEPGISFYYREGFISVGFRTIDRDKAEAFFNSIFAINRGIPPSGWGFVTESAKQSLASFCEKMGVEFPSSLR